jgi:F0F1-type ATP synthase assembly protein I
MSKASTGAESMATRNAASITTGILATLAFAVMLTANALANALPLNGVNTGQLSDEIPNLFVPTGLTFAIWGLIYLLLAGYIVVVLKVAFRKNSSGQLWEARDGWLFTVNALANAAWIIAWHWRLVPLSMTIMLVILASLYALEERNFRRFNMKQTGIGARGTRLGSPLLRFFLTVPLNVYLGWICVATIANATALLVTSGWNGFGLDPQAWTIVVILTGLVVALALVYLRNAVAAPLVVIWAYLGIVLKRTAVDPDQTRSVWMVAAVSAILIAGVLVGKLTGLIREHHSRS